MAKNDFEIVKECTESGMHLTDCDNDGFCNFCGYQESLDDFKPKFFQAKLVEINQEQLDMELKGCSLEERLPNNACCPDCGKNEWWLLPKESVAVKEGGKPYIECLNCGYQTHL